MVSAPYFFVDSSSTSRSAAITPLLNTMVRMAMRLRAAVSMSMPVMPIDASPMMLTQSFSGAELGRLTPPHVGPRRGRLPERQQLFARTAGIVGDDDVVAVHAAHEIADHAILIDGHLLGIEMLGPFREPFLLGRGHLLLERSERVGAARTLLAADLGDDGIEHERRIPDDRMIDAVLLVDVRGVI